MIALIGPDLEILDVEPLQVRNPIIDWEIHNDEFQASWKITRLGGITGVYRDFETLVKACDKEDLNTIWRMVQEKSKEGEVTDVKAKELWVHLKRLYEPDVSDRYWKFQAMDLL